MLVLVRFRGMLFLFFFGGGWWGCFTGKQTYYTTEHIVRLIDVLGSTEVLVCMADGAHDTESRGQTHTRMRKLPMASD